MSTLTHRDSRPFVDLFDWLESPLATFRPFTALAMRIESFVKDGHYVVRAELPGLDPEHDVEVIVAEGILMIKAHRHEEKVDKAHSEFRYGSFSRRIALPAGADEDHIQASYDQGILEVAVALTEKPVKEPYKRIPVRPLTHMKPS